MDKLLYIICIDDEKMVLDSLNAQLTRSFGDKYVYEFAQSAEEGLEVIEDITNGSDDENIFVVISDWLMPGMKGDEFLDVVNARLKNVKTILLTGHADHKVIQRISGENSKIHCIYKPWKEKELLNLINT